MRVPIYSQQDLILLLADNPQSQGPGAEESIWRADPEEFDLLIVWRIGGFGPSAAICKNSWDHAYQTIQNAGDIPEAVEFWTAVIGIEGPQVKSEGDGRQFSEAPEGFDPHGYRVEGY